MSTPRNPHLPVSQATNAYDLLSEIVHLILDEPRRYNQGFWLLEGAELARSNYSQPDCGTVGCVAGWAATLTKRVPLGYNSRDYVRSSQMQSDVQKLLGLNEQEAEKLFDGDAVALLFQELRFTGDRPVKQTANYALLGALHIRLFQDQYADQLKAKAV